MTAPFRIREAGSDDNDRLIELLRRCPTGRGLGVYSDRYPDFFAMTRQQGERTYVHVAESAVGDIVGCAVLVERSEVRDGKPIKVLHFGDMRIDFRFARTSLAADFIELYNAHLATGAYNHGILEVVRSNSGPSRANALAPASVIVRKEARVSMVKLFPIWNYRSSSLWKYRQATPSDFSQISKLLQATYRDVPGAPSFSLEWLQAETQKHSSFNFANIWLATDDNGKIVACLARWDQRTLRKTVVSRSSNAVTFVVRLLAWFGLMWRLPPLPQSGKPLDYQYFRWLAALPENKNALRSLLRFAMRKTREDGKYQFALVGFHERDPLRSVVRGMIRLKEPMHVYSHQVVAPEAQSSSSAAAPLARSSRFFKRSRKEAFYIDLALI